MKKIFLIISLSLLICMQAMAQDTEDLLQRFKEHRISIYNSLNLDNEQKYKINKLDNQAYKELEPELHKISLKIKKIENIANSNNCTIEQINAVRKDFEKNEQRLSVIKDKYEKEFLLILTPEQRNRYNAAKRVQEANVQREIEALQNILNNN